MTKLLHFRRPPHSPHTRRFRNGSRSAFRFPAEKSLNGAQNTRLVFLRIKKNPQRTRLVQGYTSNVNDASLKEKMEKKITFWEKKFKNRPKRGLALPSSRGEKNRRRRNLGFCQDLCALSKIKIYLYTDNKKRREPLTSFFSSAQSCLFPSTRLEM